MPRADRTDDEPTPIEPTRPDPAAPTGPDSRVRRVWNATLRVAPAAIAWAAVVAFALLSIGGPLLGRGVFLGTDVLVRYVPWVDGGVPAPTMTNNWIGDTIDFYAPQTMLLADSVRSGDIAWWNPYIIGGTPLGALPDTGLFSPLTWVWLILPASYAAGAMKLVEMTVAVVGMALLLRRWGLSSAAQAVASLVYISGGFMIAWTNWPHTRVAALIPPLFWATDRVLTGRRWRDAVPVALVVTAILLSGFPSVFGFALYGLIPYAVLRLAVLRADRLAWLRSVGIGVLGAGLGALLSAWQLIPWALHATSTIDFGERAQAPWRHLDWTAAASAVAPGMIGDVGQSAESFWISGANPIESFAYVGVGAVVLVILALVLRGRTRADRALGWFALAGAALCTVLVFQGGWLLGLFQELPIFSNNSVTRLRFLLGFFLAIAAAVGLDRVLRRSTPGAEIVEPERRLIPLPLATSLRWLTAAAFAVALSWLVLSAYRMIPDEFVLTQRQGLITAAAAAAVAGVVLLASAFIRWRPLAVGAVGVVAVLLAAQALSVTRAWWPASDSDTFYPSTATHEFLDENLGHDRFLGVGWTMFTGSNSAYQLRSVTGHGFHTPEWKAMLQSIDEDTMITRTFSQLGWDSVDSPTLDRMGVRYVVEDPGAQPAGDVDWVGTQVAQDEESGPVTSAAFTGPVRAVQVALPLGVDAGPDGRLVVRVLDEDGDVIAESSRLVPDGAARVWLAVPAEQVEADQQVRVQLEIEGTTTMSVPTDADGSWVTAIVRPADDDLRVVHGGDATVYERLTAAPRIHWADDDVVIEDEDERLDAIADGDYPTDTVILEDAADDEADLRGTSKADLDVLDDGDTVRVQVEADGDGWLVLAESVRGSGWTATIDGQETALVDADQAMGAVFVPEGTHEVTISYRPPGLTAGIAGSVAAGLALIGLAVLPPVLDRRRRRGAAA